MYSKLKSQSMVAVIHCIWSSRYVRIRFLWCASLHLFFPRYNVFGQTWNITVQFNWKSIPTLLPSRRHLLLPLIFFSSVCAYYYLKMLQKGWTALQVMSIQCSCDIVTLKLVAPYLSIQCLCDILAWNLSGSIPCHLFKFPLSHSYFCLFLTLDLVTLPMLS